MIAKIKQIHFHSALFADGVFSALPIVEQSASIDSKSTKTASGILYEHTVRFRMSSISPENQKIMDSLLHTIILRVYDINGSMFILDGSTIRLSIEVNMINGGKPGDFIGFDISFKQDSTTPLRPL